MLTQSFSDFFLQDCMKAHAVFSIDVFSSDRFIAFRKSLALSKPIFSMKLHVSCHFLKC